MIERGSRERGSGSVLLGLVAWWVLLGVALIYLLAGYVAFLHKTRADADAVALAGAQEHASGGEACRGAERIATRNGSRLEACQLVAGLRSFSVSVTVARDLPWRLPGLADSVAVTAHAGLD